MGGGLMQLVAYGAQDIYLTGNPQITFFKVVYRRHTNFSMESIKQTFSGNADYGSESATATISRNGDLIHRVWLEHVPHITKPLLANVWKDGGRIGEIHGYVPNYGHALLKEVELEIGGQTIDKQTGQWMQAWSDLTEFNPTAYGYAERSNVCETSHHLATDGRAGIDSVSGADGATNKYTANMDIGGKTLFQKMSGTGNESAIIDPGSTGSAGAAVSGECFGINAGCKVIDVAPNSATSAATVPITERIFIPLQFWFCRNVGLALPLIALQYHEVKLKFNFEEVKNLYGYIGTVGSDTSAICDARAVSTPAGKGANRIFDLWVDYIYLDTDERRRFAQVSHEYLIEQVQYIEESVTTAGTAQSLNVDLNFNHPVKELVWFARNTQDALFGTLGAATGTIVASSVFPTAMDTAGTSVAGGAAGSGIMGAQDAGVGAPNELIIRDVNAVARQHGNATFVSDVSDQSSGSWQLRLNGHDRFKERDTKYFTRTQVQDYHTGYGGVYNRDSVSVYSFALKPEEHQPSGTCNFSRIDNAELIGQNIKYPRGTNELSIYAVNYNVLRIMSGMGGLAYSN
jgi:hypothetical protein